MGSGAFDALEEAFFQEGDTLAERPVDLTEAELDAPEERRSTRSHRKALVIALGAATLVVLVLAAARGPDGTAPAAARTAVESAAPAAITHAAVAVTTPAHAREIGDADEPEPTAAPTRERPRTAKQRQKLAEAAYANGRAAYMAGRYKDSIRSFRRAVEIDRSLAKGHRSIGLAYRKLGDRRNAVRAFQAYLRAAPRAADAPKIRKMIATLR
jgi:tetratricopeptide (TPR) repeat protein